MAIPFLNNTSFNAAVTVASTLTVGGDALVEDNIYLTDGGTVRGKIQLNSSDRDNLDIKAVSLGSTMNFFTVDTLALSLDASQNATFAENVTIGSVDASVGKGLNIGNASPTIQLFDTTNDAKLLMYTQDSISIIGTYSNHALSFFTNSTQALNLDTSQNATFAGTVTSPTFLGDLNGTINTATTAVTQANAIDNTTVATTAYVVNKIAELPAGLNFLGTWNADTNTPTLVSGGGERSEGTTTTLTANKLIDSSATFTTTPAVVVGDRVSCLLYTSPSPRD